MRRAVARVDPRRLAALRKRGRPAARACSQPHVGERIAMLVVPNHWGDAPIVPGSRLRRELRGWADRASRCSSMAFSIATTRGTNAPQTVCARAGMTAGEGEFLGLTRSRSGGADRRRARACSKTSSAGRSPDSSRPPGYMAPARSRRLHGVRRPHRRRSLQRLVARDRREARSGPGDHLGEPDSMRGWHHR